MLKGSLLFLKNQGLKKSGSLFAVMQRAEMALAGLHLFLMPLKNCLTISGNNILLQLRTVPIYLDGA